MSGRSLSAAILAAAATVACAGTAGGPPRPGPGSLVFALKAVDAQLPGRVAWLASYETGGTRTRFRIELAPEPKGTKLPTFVRCALVREPGSDGSALVRDLSRALGVRGTQAVGEGVETLELSAALLGRDLSRGKGPDQIAGAFTSEPAGTWIATKLFLADGEVFLDIDPVGGYGEFAMKDPAYGRVVVREMSRLLLGDAAPGSRAGDTADAGPTTPLPPTLHPTPNPDANAVQRLMARAVPGVSQPERQKALQDLAKLGPRAAEAVPVFLTALTDEDAVIRAAALSGLPRLKPDPKIGAAAVTPLLKDASHFNQVAAAEALVDFGQAQIGVTYLTVFLRGRAAAYAAAALMRMGPEARGAVPSLIELLERGKDSQERYAACRALAAIGRDASRALPALETATNDADPSVRSGALYALREIRSH